MGWFSKSESEHLQDLHNEAEKDVANGTHNVYRDNIFDDIIGSVVPGWSQTDAEKDAIDSGRANANKQK
jgi:hypothetical protein